ncbi:unnamed protein product [Musa acuminata subsp. malaccensis]|uniref:(wild Malaysian banana) hypothetical protein n=1 Tax=Musa acuminata subsp. malaccensis TaxID=214687 RepID=A0A804L3T5_MUSAM|nr:unnamed protein product [Musa acuminata subsp. malaccensis]
MAMAMASRMSSTCVTRWSTRASLGTSSWRGVRVPAVLRECRRIIADSEIMKEDDNNWPPPDRVGRQEMEIVMNNEHISFTTSKIRSLVDVQGSQDPKGLRVFYYLVRCFVVSLISLQFKIKPIES